MGVYNCQLYNNLGLCCFYAQQYDMTLSSFERALALVSSDEEQADIWYNIGHVAVVRLTPALPHSHHMKVNSFNPAVRPVVSLSSRVSAT